MIQTSPVEISRAGAVGIIELARPEKFNCLSMSVHAAIEAAIDGFEKSDSGVRAILIRAQGKHFCTGADLDEVKSLRGDPARLKHFISYGHSVLKRLEMARALALNPRLLLLDEPLAGLNSREARALADTIAEINRQGVTIVLIEHNLGEVMRICQRLVVLDNGRKIADGEPRAAMNDSVVRAAYLGGDALATAEADGAQHA